MSNTNIALSGTVTGDTEAVVLLFDGVCNLCSAVVQFVIPKDAEGRVKFASLQSAAGQHFRRSFSIPDTVDSFIVIKNGQAFLYTDALVAVGLTLGGAWAGLATIVRIAPRPIRDLAYRILAKNRYRMFGKKDQCWIPTPALRARFLPDG